MSAKAMLRIGEGFSVPAEEFLTSATAIVGKRGRGKSSAAKRIVEEVHRVGLPFIIFDPAGVHWGLKSSGDGKSPGLENVLVIGGSHADVLLDRRAGKMVARAVVESNISCVIDFKAEPKAAYRQFVTDFCNALFEVDGDPRLVVLEEAARLVPQRVFAGEQECYAAVEKLVSQGRNEGIGVLMLSQRPATINKDVLSEVDTLLIFGLVSKQDRKAVAEWVETHDDEEKLALFDKGIAGLAKQECWVWSPELYRIFQRTKILPFRTLHGDKTHLRKLGLLNTRLVTADVSTVVARLTGEMKALAEKKKDETDAPALRAKIKMLEQRLAEAMTYSQSKVLEPSPEEVTKWKEKLAEQWREPFRSMKVELETAERTAERRGTRLVEIGKMVRELGSLHAKLDHKLRELGPLTDVTDLNLNSKRVARSPTPGGYVNDTHWQPRSPAAPSGSLGGLTVATVVEYPKDGRSQQWRKASPSPDVVSEDSADGPMGKGEKAILIELSRRPDKVFDRAEVGLVTGYALRSGTFDAYIGRLRRRGFIVSENGGLRATPDGVEAAGPIPEYPKTHDQLLVEWEKKLGSGPRRILDVLSEVYPQALGKEELAERLGMAYRSGTLDAYIQRVKRVGLVDRDRDGFKASPLLFPEVVT